METSTLLLIVPPLGIRRPPTRHSFSLWPWIVACIGMALHERLPAQAYLNDDGGRIIAPASASQVGRTS